MKNKLFSLIRNINERVAVSTTNLMGTMGCVYAFGFWSIGLPLMFPHITNFVFFVSGAIIQLISLPLIMVGQSILSRASDQRTLHVTTEINKIAIIIQDLQEVIEDLHSIMTFNNSELQEFKQIETKIDSIIENTKKKGRIF